MKVGKDAADADEGQDPQGIPNMAWPGRALGPCARLSGYCLWMPVGRESWRLAVSGGGGAFLPGAPPRPGLVPGPAGRPRAPALARPEGVAGWAPSHRRVPICASSVRPFAPGGRAWTGWGAPSPCRLLVWAGPGCAASPVPCAPCPWLLPLCWGVWVCPLPLRLPPPLLWCRLAAPAGREGCAPVAGGLGCCGWPGRWCRALATPLCRSDTIPGCGDRRDPAPTLDLVLAQPEFGIELWLRLAVRRRVFWRRGMG